MSSVKFPPFGQHPAARLSTPQPGLPSESVAMAEAVRAQKSKPARLRMLQELSQPGGLIPKLAAQVSKRKKDDHFAEGTQNPLLLHSLAVVADAGGVEGATLIADQLAAVMEDKGTGIHDPHLLTFRNGPDKLYSAVSLGSALRDIIETGHGARLVLELGKALERQGKNYASREMFKLSKLAIERLADEAKKEKTPGRATEALANLLPTFGSILRDAYAPTERAASDFAGLQRAAIRGLTLLPQIASTEKGRAKVREAMHAQLQGKLTFLDAVGQAVISIGDERERSAFSTRVSQLLQDNLAERVAQLEQGAKANQKKKARAKELNTLAKALAAQVPQLNADFFQP